MAIRFATLLIAGMIAGCTYSRPYLQDRNECGPIPESAQPRCRGRTPMTSAEYYTARNKLRNSADGASNEDDEIEEIVPLEGQYRIRAR